MQLCINGLAYYNAWCERVGNTFIMYVITERIQLHGYISVRSLRQSLTTFDELLVASHVQLCATVYLSAGDCLQKLKMVQGAAVAAEMDKNLDTFAYAKKDVEVMVAEARELCVNFQSVQKLGQM